MAIRRTVAASLLVLPLAGSAIGVQNQPPQPTFRTEANYVRVDVFPTLGGAPVVDLRRDEFELFEDNVPQRIDAFERVVVRPAGPQETRVEPNTVAQSRAMLESTRGRVFAVFLDIGHVDVTDSHRIRKPLTDALERIIGPDDLVGVMTPDMSATDVTFARRTTTIEGILARYWYWGERNAIVRRDPVEQQYERCYPGVAQPIQCPAPGGGSASVNDRGVADEMIKRRREKLALDALQDLVLFLRGVREERKAVLVVSNGWRLFGPNSNLARPVRCNAPGVPQILVDPRGGKLTTRDTTTGNVPSTDLECDRDRLNLAQLDNERQFQRLPDLANRSNVSFYPIDPRGLAAFDEPIGPNPPPPSVDRALLTRRIDTLRTLAENTDGLAIVDTNDLDRGVRRVVDDLTSYYLLGYYSTNTKLDGRFRRIAVRVKRPGVQVRARRGYLAATPEEIAAGRAATGATGGAGEAAAAAEARAIEATVGSLGAAARDLPLRLQVAATHGDVWVVGEVDWKDSGDADVTLVAPGGVTLATAHAIVAPGTRTFRTTFTVTHPLDAGEYTVRARARSAAPGAMASNDALRFTLPAGDAGVGAIFIRRGPSTANKEAPTADLRFRRSETVRVEMPATGTDPVSARLLDKTGKALAVPVTAAVREDPDGSKWQTAQLALAPLAAGDYVMELTRGTLRTLHAFRVVP